jgi:DNA polymerase V
MAMLKEIKVVSIQTPDLKSSFPIPAFLSPVQAGFPSPADDYIEKKLDLNELVIQKPAATFFVRVEGESMQDANIFSGDVLVVDRSLEAKSGDVVVAVLNGEFTVKRLVVQGQKVWLQPENPRFAKMAVDGGSDFQVWGVVTYIIHKAK